MFQLPINSNVLSIKEILEKYFKICHTEKWCTGIIIYGFIYKTLVVYFKNQKNRFPRYMFYSHILIYNNWFSFILHPIFKYSNTLLSICFSWLLVLEGSSDCLVASCCMNKFTFMVKHWQVRTVWYMSDHHDRTSQTRNYHKTYESYGEYWWRFIHNGFIFDISGS